MKLLLDQNLSRRILPAISEHFPDSNQVAMLGLELADDMAIRQFAQENDFAVVTKDGDFVELALLFGWPPKIIHLMLGNVRNDEVLESIVKHRAALIAFLESSDDAVMQIRSDR